MSGGYGNKGNSSAVGNAVSYVAFQGVTTPEVDADASVVASVSGVLSTDIVVATILAQANTVSIIKAVPTTNTLTFTLSGNGGAGTSIQYVVYRAA